MNKEVLKKLPCTAPDWMIEKAKNIEKSTFLLRRKFGNVQTYEIYITQELKRGSKVPELIVFREKKDWINYNTTDDRWTKAKFENVRISVEDNGRVHYATYYIDQYKILRNLRRWQNKIGEKRYNERIRKEQEKTEKAMSMVPELPEDFEDFVENNLMKNANYIIYNRKKDKALCTRCQGRYTVTELEIRNNTKAEHMKEYQMCPNCGTWLRQISEGMSRRDKTFSRGTEIMQTYGSGVVVREFAVYRGFESEQKYSVRKNKMQTIIKELHRYTITKEGYRQYEISGICLESGRWKKLWKDRTRRNFKQYGINEGMYYEQNIAEILQGTEMAYEGMGVLVKQYVDKAPYRTEMERITREANKKRYLEQLIKAGLKQLAKADLYGTEYRININEKETALTKMLGINREELRIIRSQKKQDEALEVIKMLKKSGRTTQKELVEMLIKARGNGSTSWDMERLLESKCNTEKALRYINEKAIGINDFIDHINLMDKLGIPEKKNNLYPADFEKFHQEEIEEDMLRNEKQVSDEVNKTFQKTYKRWTRLINKYKVTTEGEDYKIILPKSPADIKTEGRCLHHCVGNYATRAAQGETFIFYVRKQEKIRMYTAEYKDGKLIQVRGSCNKDPEKEARKLAEQFAKELKAAEEKEAKLKERKKSTKQTAVDV